ncbi:MAG: hypothetical protein AAGA55_06135, partial [Planctomycetota bacterium]
RIRPGISMIAARHPHVKLLTIAIEYAFWNDQRPEIFVRAAPVERPNTPGTPAWHRAIARAMRENASDLARGVIARDPAFFTEPFQRSSTRINPVYDAMARLRGRSTRLPSTHTGQPEPDRGTS